MVPVGTAGGQAAYAPRVGGSCLNVAVALARLGTRCGFVGGISSDFFGQMIRDRLSSAGVDLRYASFDDLETTLAFVSLNRKDAQYVFYDTATAGRSWVFEADLIDFDKVEAVHIGSVTLIGQPSASSFEALAYLAQSKCIVSFDPNCRPTLVTDHLSYRSRMIALARRSDVIRYSAEDFDYLYPGQSEDEVSQQLVDEGASLVVITRGSEGATAYTRRCRVSRPAPVASLVDTIGAGDTFQAGLLTGLSEGGYLDREKLCGLNEAELARLLDFAMLAASKTCEKEGADPPFRHELEQANACLELQL
jgi:fructokinase